MTKIINGLFFIAVLLVTITCFVQAVTVLNEAWKKQFREIDPRCYELIVRAVDGDLIIEEVKKRGLKWN